jgi:hypothetical protein
MEPIAAPLDLVHRLIHPQRNQLFALYQRQWFSHTRSRAEVDLVCDGPSLLQ